jgi:cell division protein FtsB
MRNKYFITGMVFLAWLTFFDANNLVRQLELRSNLDELQREKEYYLDQIKLNHSLTEELRTNQSTLEKFAREKYLMKRDNEDIYLIIRNP